MEPAKNATHCPFLTDLFVCIFKEKNNPLTIFNSGII